MHFFQEPPHIGNQFLEDQALQSCLKAYLPPSILNDIKGDLERFGEDVASSVLELGKEAESNPPFLTKDSWGKPTQHIHTCQAWKKLHDVAAKEGVIAIGYEEKYGEYRRIYQYVKLMLFSASSAVYTCPLAMTDGAATIMKDFYGNERCKSAFHHLTSRIPEQFWTSGQWMTERIGGSDMSNIETVAEQIEGDLYYLCGFKWFTSATDSNMALTLAKIKRGSVIDKHATAFFLYIREENGNLNGITISRLKDKLGTRAVPTAELDLKNTKAWIIGKPQRGVPVMSKMLNITRMHNTVSSVSFMRRIIAICRDYASRRKVYGKYLREIPLHIRTLSDMEVEYRGCLHLMLYCSLKMGISENKEGNDVSNVILRVLTPIAKLYTAKKCVSVVSEGLEAIGGQGYVEDTCIPRMYRDAQVLPIWEGTTNVLSVDLLRALKHSPNGLELVFEDLLKNSVPRFRNHTDRAYQECEDLLTFSINELKNFWQRVFLNNISMETEVMARDFAMSLAKVVIAALLYRDIEREASFKETSEYTFLRYCQLHNPLFSIPNHSYSLRGDKLLGLSLDQNGQPIGCGDVDSRGLTRPRF